MTTSLFLPDSSPSPPVPGEVIDISSRVSPHAHALKKRTSATPMGASSPNLLQSPQQSSTPVSSTPVGSFRLSNRLQYQSPKPTDPGVDSQQMDLSLSAIPPLRANAQALLTLLNMSSGDPALSAQRSSVESEIVEVLRQLDSTPLSGFASHHLVEFEKSLDNLAVRVVSIVHQNTLFDQKPPAVKQPPKLTRSSSELSFPKSPNVSGVMNKYFSFWKM
jgi:hypothetical protein